MLPQDSTFVTLMFVIAHATRFWYRENGPQAKSTGGPDRQDWTLQRMIEIVEEQNTKVVDTILRPTSREVVPCLPHRPDVTWAAQHNLT